MAFHENPIVDDKSERSEESVLSVRQIFTKKNGFISREENPDYGVDLDVELVAERGATSNKFPIQIKSTQEVNIIDVGGTSFISLQFKTSRLGYLCRRAPAYGIVVIYDESSKMIYFDYVEEIVARINREKDSDQWKEQETVNIHVPLQQLNEMAANIIHGVMANRYQNHDRMIGAYGGLYKIPTFNDSTDAIEIDFNNIDQVESFLKGSGVGLFNAKEYPMLVDLLSRLPLSRISSSKEILFVAAITYGQTGMIIESDYCLERSRTFWDEYKDDEKLSLEYQTLMTGFRKGKIPQRELESGLIRLKGRAKSTLSHLTLDINIVYVNFLTAVNEGKVNQTTFDNIEGIALKIKESDLSAHDKVLLRLFNLENLHNYGTDLLLKDGSKFILQNRMQIDVSLSERIKRVEGILSILNAATGEVMSIYNDAKVQNDKVAHAFAAYYKARFFFSKCFHTMLLSATAERRRDDITRKTYGVHVRICYESISLFFDLGMLHEAHQALTCAYDLQSLYETLYQENLEDVKNLEELESSIRKVEDTSGIARFKSIVREAFFNLRQPDKSSWADLPPDKVDDYAEMIVTAYGLPPERKVHVVADINAHRIFERECENEEIELLQDLTHLQIRETTYATPPKFILKSKASGIESKKSKNIYELLEQFSGILKKGK